jgi:peptidoglycan hydrolase CwlO-like protein
MQKQLMIREKKRSASRLEKKASEFEDKKKALQVLNEDIEERRQQLISDQMELKKKYEPDAYEAILLKDKNDLASK